MIYRVHFVDHGNNVRSVEYIERATDPEAIEAAHNMNVPTFIAGFDMGEDVGCPPAPKIPAEPAIKLHPRCRRRDYTGRIRGRERPTGTGRGSNFTQRIAFNGASRSESG